MTNEASHQSSNAALICPTCLKSFATKFCRNRHIASHRCKPIDYRSTRCQRDTDKRRQRCNSTLSLHDGTRIPIERKADEPWICPRNCGTAFKRDDSLRIHLLRGCKPRVPGNIPSAGFQTQTLLSSSDSSTSCFYYIANIWLRFFITSFEGRELLEYVGRASRFMGSL